MRVVLREGHQFVVWAQRREGAADLEKSRSVVVVGVGQSEQGAFSGGFCLVLPPVLISRGGHVDGETKSRTGRDFFVVRVRRGGRAHRSAFGRRRPRPQTTVGGGGGGGTQR